MTIKIFFPAVFSQLEKYLHGINKYNELYTFFLYIMVQNTE